MKKILAVLLSIFLLASCKNALTYKYTFRHHASDNNYLSGFSIYDLKENKTVFWSNAHCYFQPASNNKIFTLYAGLKTLGDSVPALKYVVKNDSLIFWGTGDPSLLHPDLPKSNVIDFLKNRPEKLYFSTSNEVKNKFGSGWMLEDYNEYYQAEISALPIYGNIVRITKSTQDSLLNISPKEAISCCIDSTKNNSLMITRQLGSDYYSFPNIKNLPQKFEQDIPFNYDFSIEKLLNKAIEKKVESVNIALPSNHKTIYSIKSDSLYKRMLLVSDNMIAEQIILLASKSDTLDTSKSIANILKTYLSDLPDRPRWVDSSGLSRYNLTTPRSLVHVLKKIYAEFPKERIFDLMPSNTKGIYAKSGSYSNNYNLSGYLIGNSGKTYAFSFMNNNFMIPMAEIRKEVERILVGLQRKL